MGTVATVRVISAEQGEKVQVRMAQALGWFAHVEAQCTRFDPASELMQLCRNVGRPVAVSDLLFGLITMALALARRSRGAFDPTVGLALERAGFDRHHRTGEHTRTPISEEGRPTYRDIQLDPRRRTVTLRCPMVLDLGAVAKGLAIDLAARELHGYPGYAVEAGGDLYLGGHSEYGARWAVGIRHPRTPGALIDILSLSDVAVCTSGDYERRVDAGSITHHLLDPRAGRSAGRAISATVVAPSAMLADGLSTTAFVLGPRRGLSFLERAGAEGLIVTPQLQLKETTRYAQYRAATTGTEAGRGQPEPRPAP
jgi:thiamine biosynthesis lipoprotein